MDNIITKISENKVNISAVMKAYRDLPVSGTDDTAAALAARVFCYTRLFGTSFMTLRDLTEELCDEESHGICTYQAYKLTEVFGKTLTLDMLRQIMYGILKAETGSRYDISFLDRCAGVLAETFEYVFFNSRKKDEADYGVIAAALLCLAGREETDRFNYAYDAFIPSVASKWYGSYDNVHTDTALALELLIQSDETLSELCGEDEYDEIMGTPILYRTLLIAALAYTAGDRAFTLFAEPDGLSNAAFDKFITDSDDTDDDYDDDDPFELLDWDEFFVDESV